MNAMVAPGGRTRRAGVKTGALFGCEFELIEAVNRYGLPPFYELRAWIWMHSSSGMFDDWNPNVSC
jgi:hypothetical protein